MSQKRILFVDDEENVLNGLRRMLHPFHHEWEMHFSSSGHDALIKLTEQPFDVVVSDMQMPGMTGEELLRQVKQKYPNTIRIILSGMNEEKVFLRIMDSTHQFLSEPCDAAILSSTITRICKLRKSLPDDVLSAIINQIDSLPSIPSIYLEVIKEAELAETSLTNLSNLISQDMGMSTKILQLVNSAFFGFFRQISSIPEALNLLGTKRIKNLILGIHIFSKFKSNAFPQHLLDAIWEHSMRCSGLAVRLTNFMQLPDPPDQHALAALLHDVGKLVFATSFPGKYAQLMSASASNNFSLSELEQQSFKTTHAEIGAYLLGIWGIPDNLIDAVAFHHHPTDASSHRPILLATTHIANVFDHQIISNNPTTPYDKLDSTYLETINILKTVTNLWENCRPDMITDIRH